MCGLVLHKKKKTSEDKLVPLDWWNHCCGRSLTDFLRGKIIYLNVISSLFFLSGQTRTFTSPFLRLFMAAVFPLFVASVNEDPQPVSYKSNTGDSCEITSTPTRSFFVVCFPHKAHARQCKT